MKKYRVWVCRKFVGYTIVEAKDEVEAVIKAREADEKDIKGSTENYVLGTPTEVK